MHARAHEEEGEGRKSYIIFPVLCFELPAAPAMDSLVAELGVPSQEGGASSSAGPGATEHSAGPGAPDPEVGATSAPETIGETKVVHEEEEETAEC